MSDFLKSHLRTYVPIWVGALAAWLAAKGIDLDVNAAVLVVTGVVTSAYYTLARVLERYPSTAFLGRFLLSVGFAAAPVYGGAVAGAAGSAGSGGFASGGLLPDGGVSYGGGEGFDFSSERPRG
ncbi:hypothetical protein GCM10022252_75990 [Streptosporangium oxazolinicum]|uniref:Holin n=1 Tax=Streptosporangium oxazolinicum TaxID=909287 RepID=A0ABP8BM81_9ACTN